MGKSKHGWKRKTGWSFFLQQATYVLLWKRPTYTPYFHLIFMIYSIPHPRKRNGVHFPSLEKKWWVTWTILSSIVCFIRYSLFSIMEILFLYIMELVEFMPLFVNLLFDFSICFMSFQYLVNSNIFKTL